ncbi:MAG: hypothetical protein JSU94_16085 [Phycisphaerales bacterium]|nr:MAG: hypothetical protein JSU94_16085 [Phycisphaerales bacterium]
MRIAHLEHSWKIAVALLYTLLAGLSPAAHDLPQLQRPDGLSRTVFELGGEKGAYERWGLGKEHGVFFEEFLPALFERTLVLNEADSATELAWIFTGPNGGFTVTLGEGRVSLRRRLYDSSAFLQMPNGGTRHPEWSMPIQQESFKGRLRAVTVRLDHRLGLSVELNGRKVFAQTCLLDVSRHQLRMIGQETEVRGEMLKPVPEAAVVRIEPARQHQTMLGFGGIATPTAYAQLSEEGKRKWWEFVSSYNLLIQREYPIGRRLNEQMDNWDRLSDASPHNYGDNFPNGEISNFDYIKMLRRLGGKVMFEFWALPPWVGGDVQKYAEAMVRYCQISRQRVGRPPDIVGIQNEVGQSAEMFGRMTLALRRRLDEEGFDFVRIHMSDSGHLSTGIKRARAFLSSDQVWKAIDYAAVHMYDYQNFFTNPDGFDELLRQWKKTTADRPFLSTELCINRPGYQWPTYRVALTMGQLYHKNLVLADAVAICYCWTLLNVVQPSYGWTRSLFVPDHAHGFVPAPSSRQLRVFGAFSRRIREGMVRIEAGTDSGDLLVSAFAGQNNSATVVLLNRSTTPRRVRVVWPGTAFTHIELVDPYHENSIRTVPRDTGTGPVEALVDPGAIVTLSNVPVGRMDESATKLIEPLGGN